MTEDKRTPRFAERFSKWLMTTAGIGSAVVLLTPELTFKWEGGIFHLGGGVFSDEIRGAVVGALVLTAIGGLIRMWLPGNETPPPIAGSTTSTTSTTTKEPPSAPSA